MLNKTLMFCDVGEMKNYKKIHKNKKIEILVNCS